MSECVCVSPAADMGNASKVKLAVPSGLSIALQTIPFKNSCAFRRFSISRQAEVGKIDRVSFLSKNLSAISFT